MNKIQTVSFARRREEDFEVTNYFKPELFRSLVYQIKFLFICRIVSYRSENTGPMKLLVERSTLKVNFF